MQTLYQTHTLQSISDNEWYFARYKTEYMPMYSLWKAELGKTIKQSYPKHNLQIVGPIQKPDDHE